MWNCKFGSPDWTTCYTTDWYRPLLIGLFAAMLGLIVQGSQHWGFYATIGTDETDLGFFTGIHNVYTVWYVLDSQIGAFFTFNELIWNTLMLFAMGGNIIGFNLSFSSPYVYLGVFTVFYAFVYQSSMAIIMAYNVINSAYLQSRYDPYSVTTIEFPNLFNQFDGNRDTWLSILVFIEQLLVGNKRLALYNNFLAALALSYHPISIPFSMYFWAQIPA